MGAKLLINVVQVVAEGLLADVEGLDRKSVV